MDQTSKESRYVALTHRWGTQPITKLLTSNLAEMQESIDLDTLPRTFRDAIEVTRNLKMKYLWIDSFCIIQDSAENWEQESAVMGDIYENCVFNIAATGASDGEDGMVYTRTPILAQPLLVNAWSTSPLEERSACSSRKSTLFLLSTFSMWRRNILFAALNTRGWGLQERILAPRTIHFTRTQLFWECAELVGFVPPPPEPNKKPGWETANLISPLVKHFLTEFLNGSCLGTNGIISIVNQHYLGSHSSLARPY